MELVQFSFKKIIRITIPTLIVFLLYKIYYLGDLQNHYQVDFSSYYAAGLLLNDEENPYFQNPIYKDDLFSHSQYLQPPIVAQIFRIFTALTYEQSKSIWVLLNIIIFILLIEATMKSNMKYIIYFLSIMFLDKIFYPFYTLFERGQTDLLIVLLIYMSFRVWRQGSSLFGGAILAIASIMKIPVIFLFSVPFAVKDRIFIYAGISMHIIMLIMSVFLIGVEINKKYFFNYLPHIGKTGSLPTELLMNSKINKNIDYSINNKVYENQLISHHVSGGSITKYFNSKIIGIIGFIMGFIFVNYLLKMEYGEDIIELAWISSMLIILYFHPMTHVMQYVWMILIVTMLVNIKRNNDSEFSHLTNQFFNWSLAVGLLLIGMGEDLGNFFKNVAIEFHNSFYFFIGHNKILNIINDILYERVWIGCSLIIFSVALIIIEKKLINRGKNSSMIKIIL